MRVRCAHDQRQADAIAIQIVFRAGKRPAVVAEENDERVIGAPARFQFAQKYTDTAIEAADRFGVFGEIAAYVGKIGQMRRHFHIRRRVASTFDLGPLARVAELRGIAGAVRVAVADRQEKRTVLVFANPFSGGVTHRGDIAIARLFGQQPRVVGEQRFGFDVQFADECGRVAGLLEHPRQRFHVFQQREVVHVVAESVHAVGVRIQTGVQRRAARTAR